MSRVPMGTDGGAWAMDPETALLTHFVPQGISADLIATLEGFSREDVDAYALRSQTLAAKEWADVFGLPVARSVVTDPLEVAGTEYRGEPTPRQAELASQLS